MKMLKEGEFDLGKSKITDLFLTIWIPTLISLVITGTFIVVDLIFITHGFSANSIFGEVGWNWTNDTYGSYGSTAIGYAMPFVLIIISIGAMIGGAFGYNLSKAKASNDHLREQRVINSFFPVCIISGIILTLLLFPFAKFWIWMGSGFQPIFKETWFINPLFNSEVWSNAEPNIKIAGHIFQQSSWYLRIQALGAIPYIALMGAPFLLREEGKPVVSIYISSLGFVMNIFLDFFLVIILGLNLIGASIATTFTEIIGTLAFFYYLKHYAKTRVTKLDWKTAKDDFGQICKNGTSYMGTELLQTVILLTLTMSIGFVFYGQYDVILFYSACFSNYSSMFAFLNIIALATLLSVVPLINYSYNIRDHERLKEAKKLGLNVLILICTLCTILMVVFPVIITTVFVAPNNWLSQRITQILFLSFTFGNLILFAGLYFQGMGQVTKANLLIFSKPLLVFILAITIGLTVQAELAWKDPLFNWNASYYNDEGIGGVYLDNGKEVTIALGIFWVVPFVDILIGIIGISLMECSLYKHKNEELPRDSQLFKKRLKQLRKNYEIKKKILIEKIKTNYQLYQIRVKENNQLLLLLLKT